MDFVCVLSVYGSLVSYVVKKIGENRYRAVSKSNNGISRDDIPQEIELEKTNAEWKANPWHEEIVPGLTHCIDAAV